MIPATNTYIENVEDNTIKLTYFHCGPIVRKTKKILLYKLQIREKRK